MTKPAFAALTTLALSATTALAEIRTTSSVYLGYGNDPQGETRFLGVGRVSTSGDFALGQGVALEFKGDLYLRSDHDDLSYIWDEWADVDLGLNMGDWGTLGVSTYARCGARQVPWINGKVEQQGSVAVHPRLGNRMRCVGGDNDVFGLGPQIADTAGYVYYRNRFDKLGVELFWDPVQDYSGLRGEDARSLVNMGLPGTGDRQPELEARFDLALGKVVLVAGVNDLKDSTLGLVVPMPEIGLTAVVETTHRDQGGNNRSNSVLLDYQPQTAGMLKSIWALYMWDANDENLVVSARFGRDAWTLGLAADADGDFAVEGSWAITDKLEILAGADSGFDVGDGFTYNVFPPVVTRRDPSYEIGIRFAF